jgi:uncharacterized protein (UPF0261 family)
MPTVVLLGTLDTKGQEYAYVRDRLHERGVATILVDAGILGAPSIDPDITREEVARAGEVALDALVGAADRGRAIAAMTDGARAIVCRLFAEGRLDAILGFGGSGGSTLIAAAMRELPIGVPKLLVSTVAAGDTRPYAGLVDLTLMPAVVDIAGINHISQRILDNAAAAIAAMAETQAAYRPPASARPVIAATMFGVTTPCVSSARERLEGLGYEVVVFHATGTGGQAMEHLIRDGYIAGVLDATTTELADDLVGGVLSAGPGRLTAAGEMGIPQVVSVGALDMVNFGPRETVPARFADRLLYEHNPTVTLMRTTPEECAELGRRLAAKLNQARGPVTLFLPLRGISAIATEGGVFHDPAADAALFGAIRDHLAGNVVVREMAADINDPAFAEAMADALHDLVRERVGGQERIDA